MTKGPAPEYSTSLGDINGWRAYFVKSTEKISGNNVWNNHNYAAKSPDSDDRLIGYIWGTHISGGDRIIRSVSSRATGNISVQDVFDGNKFNLDRLYKWLSPGFWGRGDIWA